ncbi:MAG: gfo/Idh/MocA family oxidoreductase [bacterium]|nr:gfo/Idh/MocA family oxidoreductase [bacterium]
MTQPRDKKFRVATVGTGWWGMNITRCAIQSGDADLVAICDVDKRHLQAAAEEITGMTGKKPQMWLDFRDLLEKSKPEIVIIGTPDHWHPLITIAACNAGAHVYVEKPVGHTLLEGRAMVNAARANDRVVQVGTHRRVSPHNVWGMDFVRSGKLGKVGMIRAFVHSGGGAGQPIPDEEPPEYLDWDMWCGPAPLCPYNPRMHPKGFRSFLNYANGTLGDWGIHWMDHITWFAGDNQTPKRISSMGGRHIKRDNTDAPDTQTVQFEFDGFTAVWEHRQYAANNAEKHPLGIYFYGTEGTLHIGWVGDGTTFYPANKNREIINVPPQLHEPDQQNIPELWANFTDSIRNQRRSVSDIEIGHRSTSLSMLGMLSYKLGRGIEWDGEKERVIGDEEANQMLRREYRAPWTYPEV